LARLDRSGAVRSRGRGAFRLGARPLAQPYTTAALEVTFGGLSVRARGDLQPALTGAQAPAAVDGRTVGYFGPFIVADGPVLTLGTLRPGCVATSRHAAASPSPPFWVLVQPTPCQVLDRRRCEPATCYPSVRPRRHFPTRTSFQLQRGRPRPSFCMHSVARETTGSATETLSP
jgi:hypothetical protein